jgi:UDPglucose 6-dehydrogenase
MTPQKKSFRSNIAVIGTGYVGLTTGACMAHLGHSVVCVDKDEQKLALIEDGEMPIYEVGLAEMVEDGRQTGRLSFSSDLGTSVREAEFIFLCLPTPADSNGEADLSAIHSVMSQLKNELRPQTIVINKSTVPVNSVAMFSEMLGNPQVHVVSNPEFLREGTAVEDFLKPDRIVIGGMDKQAISRVGALYQGVEAPIIYTDSSSAESIKYMANAFLAMKISFVNQVSEFCDAIGADVLEVMRGLSSDPRIGSTFLSPGPGWGGSCFPKDTQALVKISQAVGSPMSLISETIVANDQHIQKIAGLIRSKVQLLQSASPRIGVLGLSFKANTDDTRFSPAIEIIKKLQPHFPNIVAYDPVAKLPEDFNVVRTETAAEAIRGADVVLLLTEWTEFGVLNPHLVSEWMKGNIIIDTRYIIDRVSFEEAGLKVTQYGVLGTHD